MFSSELINIQNKQAAFSLAMRCFPQTHDQELVRRVYDAFSGGIDRIFSPAYQEDIRLISYWLHTIDGHSCGVSGLYHTVSDPKIFWLGWFAVAPEYRGKGLASSILKRLEVETLQRGCTVLATYTEAAEERLQRFYSRRGYKNKRNASIMGEPVVVLEKNLMSDNN